MLATLLLVGLWTQACPPVGGVADLVIHDDAKMASADVRLEEEVPSVCKCKAVCYVTAACMAVTTEETSANKCYYSFNVDVQTTLTVVNTSYVTYVKKGCGPGFVLISGRCYYFSTMTADQGTAKGTCHLGSALAYPATDGEKKDLKTYVETNRADVGNWYVDVKLDTVGSWYWSNGVQAKDSSLKLDHLAPCATMVASSSYALGNTACSEAYHYICQHEPQT